MNNTKKILALVLALMLVLGMMSAFANESSEHTITINNTDQNVPHTYEAYQIFVGKLDAGQTKLSDIKWGSGVNGSMLLNALKGDETYGSNFNACETAADVATVLSAAPFSSTAAAIEAVSRIIGEAEEVLKASGKVAFTRNDTAYTAPVTGDGYYFIKDTTTTLTGQTGSDTLSQYLLKVVKNISVNAKDTHLTPDKEIVEGSQRVKTGTAAVGDTVHFQVTIPVPDTTKYIDHFVFIMNDTLPAGLTFTGIEGIYVGDVTNKVLENNPDWTLSTDDYALTVKTGTGNYGTYTVPSDTDAVNATGGQMIRIKFFDFKDKVEGEYTNPKGESLVGKTVVVQYKAVVNKDADFTPTGNENEVYFDYSTDPNHDYNGDEPGSGEPMGESPHDKTKTLLINLEIIKKGEGADANALSGAEFEITSSVYNVTLVSGEKFEQEPYTAQEGETVVAGKTFYKLKDGNYTETAPTSATSSLYDSTVSNKTFVKVTYSRDVVTPTGETKKVTVLTDENGKILLEGLKPGTYTIKETRAPSGYNLDSTEYTIKINWTGTAFAKDSSSSNNVVWTWDTTNQIAKASITIQNHSGSTLPETGGIGTTIFYVGGGLLVLLAIVLLVTKRRMSSEE